MTLVADSLGTLTQPVFAVFIITWQQLREVKELVQLVSNAGQKPGLPNSKPHSFDHPASLF